MIVQLSGQIAKLGTSFFVLDVRGVGYQIFATGRSLSSIGQIGDEVTVLTQLAVREDSMTLYGFINEHERDAFSLLQTVQGVGAKAALSILSVLSADDLAEAILAADKAMIARADGVGPKIAQRIINELAQKITGLTATIAPIISDAGASSIGVSQNIDDHAFGDALSALVNLGYSRSEAFAALRAAH